MPSARCFSSRKRAQLNHKWTAGTTSVLAGILQWLAASWLNLSSRRKEMLQLVLISVIWLIDGQLDLD